MMKKDTKSLLWGVLAGSVVGTVTALLFAPKPGKELRKDIAEGTTGAIDKVQEIAGQAGEKTSELYGKAKEAVVSVVSEVKEWRNSSTESDDEAATVAISGIAAEEAVEEAGISDLIADEEAGAADLAEDTAEEADTEAVLEEDIEDGKSGGLS
jgi:gas vesicle protein